MPRGYRSRGRRRHCGICLGVIIVMLRLTIVDGQAQSLGDVAAREAARRAAITTPARVFTNLPRRQQDPIVAPEPPRPPVRAPESIASAFPPAAAPVVPPAPSVRATAAPVPVAAVPERNSPAPSVQSAQRPTPQVAAMRDSPRSLGSSTPAPSLAGWSAFQIKKTQAELTETARLADGPQAATRTSRSDVRLPPQTDAMKMSTGVGYLQGADWGADVAGSGKINGMQADVNAFVTAGALGFQARSGHVSLVGPGGRWRGEGGDLYSDLRGVARGARVSWSAGQHWTPSVSVYLQRREGASTRPAVVAYRDRLQVLPRVRVGGEVTSDGAALLQGQYGQPRLDLTAFYRFTRSPIAGRDKGLSGSLNIGRGVALSGALRLSDAVGDSSQWQLASFRLPLVRQASVTLERSWWKGAADDGATNALTIQLPLGPVRVVQRVQWGRTDYPHRAVPFGFNRRQSQSTASYTPGPWGSVNYQQSTQWFDDGRVQEWDEVSWLFQLGGRTTAQFATAFPDVSDPRRFRARVTQRLSATLLIEAQYGRLSAFQMTHPSEGEQSRVMVTLRKSWQVDSPARGGDIRGRAIDQAGYPVSGALVRLGPYSAITDDAGNYMFTRVPDGQFELALDKNKLPAAYAWDEKPRSLTITRNSREHVDMQVIPLNAIRGRVYLDLNRNGYFDAGEGVPNAVMIVNGSVTTTGATGLYAFYNHPPGRHKVRLDVSRLAKGLAASSPVELEVELTGEHPILGVDFTLEKRDMPIIMRGIPR